MKLQKTSLLKALQRAGMGSRRSLAELIMQGKISVNNIKVDNLNFPVNTDRDTVTFQNRIINLKSRELIVIMLNKPKDVISSTRDDRGRKTVIDLLPEKYRGENLFPIGRLDKNSTGLLLLTNDGDLAYKLTHPKFEHEKEYHIQIRGRLSLEQKKAIEKGMELEDGITYPAIVKEIHSPEPCIYSIVIHEGRKRQVRRMFETMGHSVISLNRIRIGELYLGNLKINGIRELTKSDINKLLSR